MVVLPRAPVTGAIVSVPDVALPIAKLPAVPDAPSVGVAVPDNTPAAEIAVGICPDVTVDPA